MEKTLLIMAGGMGSRFGGLKQIEPVGPNGEIIIDYSIYDALRTGFTKVVFVIKEEHYDLFKETIGKRIEEKIKVEYVFQKNSDLPAGFALPAQRVKPLGTAHAILSAKNVINEPFGVINADDFYGLDAYEKLAKFLEENHDDTNYATIGYLMRNTLSANGAVKRGFCEVSNGKVTNFIESNVTNENGVMMATPLDGSSTFILEENALTNMNMFGFKPSLFKHLEENFVKFLNAHQNDLSTAEYLIPTTLKEGIEKNEFTMDVISTSAIWYGITYREDLDIVKNSILKYIDEEKYPQNLWQ